MNNNLSALFAVAQKPERHIVGLMSGTSLDGLDIALCAVSGFGTRTAVRLLKFTTTPYTDDIRAEIRRVFAKAQVDFAHLAMLNEWIGNLHADMVLQALQDWGLSTRDVDLIASHGQTVMHAPARLHQCAKFPNATLQIGDGDHIAVRTGILTLSDFRQKHLAAGGEGAPLAVYGDIFIFGKLGENRIMLNMGGIANFTYLPADLDPHRVFVTDTGTGNTLLDACTRHFFPSQNYDKDAVLALQGQRHEGLLQALMAHPFFGQTFPKTTGPELFNMDYLRAAQAASSTQALGANDLLATLVHFSAETIASAMHFAVLHSGHLTNTDFTVYLSGGGMHNPLLISCLQKLLCCRFMTTDDLGISGDAKEAVLFAVLANECIAGGAADFGLRQGIPSVTLGKLSFPW